MMKRVRDFISFCWRNFKRDFLAGLAVILPIVVSVFVIVFLIKQMNRAFLFLTPRRFEYIVKFPGVAIIATITGITVAGFIMRNRIGKRFQEMLESLVKRIPFLRTIYLAVKKLSEAFVQEGDRKFQKVVLVEFPRKGAYSIGFITNEGFNFLQGKFVSVFIPTTPNPTSGFMLLLSKEDVTEINMNIEEAFQIIISGGLAYKIEEELKSKGI